VGYNSVADNTGLSSIVYLLLPPKYKKCDEIPTEFDLTATQLNSTQSVFITVTVRLQLQFKVIDLGVNGKPICDSLPISQ